MSEPDPYRWDMMMLLWATIRETPGVWSTWLCRDLNDVAQDVTGVTYCGRCVQYANPRKQARARGHETGNTFALHGPCGWTLNQVKGMLRDMEYAQMVNRVRFYIPDPCGQGRDWDIAARWVDSDQEVDDELLRDWAAAIPSLATAQGCNRKPLRWGLDQGSQCLHATHEYLLEVPGRSRESRG